MLNKPINKSKVHLIRLFLATILLYSCKSNLPNVLNEKNITDTFIIKSIIEYPSFKTGVLINTIKCSEDSSQSYAAYLPNAYDSKKQYPILIAFDAHAGGRIPVELYASLAEKYQYILVGSNNSKNGMSPELIDQCVNVLLKDVGNKMSINKNRIYLTGFSGGARVAANVAMQNNICGLAACSAGFQPTDEIKFNYIGFAGNEDFNSNEMLELDRVLEKSSSKHAFVLFDGKHEWPSREVFESAFVWFEINAMKDRLEETNQDFLNKVQQSTEKKIAELSVQGKYLSAYYLLKNNLNLLNGIANCSGLQNEKNKLEANPTFVKMKNENEAIQNKEKELQNFYRNAIQTKDLNWWMKEIDELNQVITKTSSIEEKLMYKRTMSFLSLLSYMVSNSLLNQNQFRQADAYLDLYKKVDPSNSEVYYLKAVLSAKTRNFNDVIPYLKKSVKLGFNDKERINTEFSFKELANNKDFLEIQELMSPKK